MMRSGYPRPGQRLSRARSAGFTLLEIMMALAVGGIALSSIYAVGAASTRHFREQQRISAAQTSLRSAMDQLKRDFQRAGFLATPNVRAPGEACGLPTAPIDDNSGGAGTGRLAAISAFNENVQPRPTSLDPGDLNAWATVDQVTLMGNYVTSGEYSGITIAADGVTVTIPMNWQSFSRDFTEWSGPNAGQCNATAFASAFPVGRLVRIHTLTERVFFSQVSSASCPSAGPGTVVLVDRVPAFCNANLGWIAPVNTINFQVVNAAGDEVTRVGGNRVSVLHRTEVLPTNKATPLTRPGVNVPIDDRSILDYVVNFHLEFLLSGGSINSVNFVPTAEANVKQTPERLRGVIINLASRTTEQEPQFISSGLQIGLAFRVLATPGAARVRRLRAELLLPNVAFEGY
jgi:prepilin-type N-terminal cleavage/methylation domain-containing protein